jgi:hypothetical protein
MERSIIPKSSSFPASDSGSSQRNGKASILHWDRGRTKKNRGEKRSAKMDAETCLHLLWPRTSAKKKGRENISIGTNAFRAHKISSLIWFFKYLGWFFSRWSNMKKYDNLIISIFTRQKAKRCQGWCQSRNMLSLSKKKKHRESKE